MFFNHILLFWYIVLIFCIFYIVDLCDSLECNGLGSNQCVNGRCVCGISASACPATRPVCYGDGLSATCVCYPGSCDEPNPVCDPADGTCKVRPDFRNTYFLHAFYKILSFADFKIKCVL